MQHDIKLLADAISNHHLKKLVESHVKELLLEEGHLIIYVDNQGPLSEMEGKDMDEHLKKGLEAIFDPDITYELRLHKGDHPHEREKAVPHNIR